MHSSLFSDSKTRKLKWFERIIIYGAFGWCIEVLFTGLADQILGNANVSLKGYSYLWMFIVWGIGLYLLEIVELYLKSKNIYFFYRVMLYTFLCLMWEYIFGITFLLVLGKIPWDYSRSSWSINGAIRLDYFPFWFLFALFVERLLKVINKNIRIMSE